MHGGRNVHILMCQCDHKSFWLKSTTFLWVQEDFYLSIHGPCYCPPYDSSYNGAQRAAVLVILVRLSVYY